MHKSRKYQLQIASPAMLFIAAMTLLHLLANDARAESPQLRAKVGEEYVFSKQYETAQQTSDGASGSSRGRDAIVERVIGVRDDGLVLEYDLPKDATAAQKAQTWQFPARVFRPTRGSIQLLNHPELKARLMLWLKAAHLTQADCGRWIFTWDAFRIECDPQSVLKTIEDFDLRFTDVGEGVPYRDAGAKGIGTLTRKAARADGSTFAAVMEIDPDAVHRARADADIAIGEIMRTPLTSEAALRERAKESVSGTVSVTFDTDSTGSVLRRTKVTEVKTQRPDGKSENQTVTEIVERRSASQRATSR